MTLKRQQIEIYQPANLSFYSLLINKVLNFNSEIIFSIKELLTFSLMLVLEQHYRWQWQHQLLGSLSPKTSTVVVVESIISV